MSTHAERQVIALLQPAQQVLTPSSTVSLCIYVDYKHHASLAGISRLAHARSAEESAAYTATDSGADQQGPDLSPLSPLLQRQFHIFLPLATSSSQHTAADKCGGHVTSVLMATPMNGRQLCIADQMAMAALTVPVVRSVTTTPFHPRILLLLLSGVTRTSSAQATTP